MVEVGAAVGGDVAGGTVVTVDATARPRSPSGSPVTATATRNDTSASTTEPPAISSTCRTSGSNAYQPARGPYRGPWTPGGAIGGERPPWPPAGAPSQEGLWTARRGCGGPRATGSSRPGLTGCPQGGLSARGSRRRRVSAMVGRPPGGLVRRAVRAGARGPASSVGRGRSLRMAAGAASLPARMASLLSSAAPLPAPPNGVSPSTARNRTVPRDQRSAGGPAVSPLTCSGARKAVVRRSAPGAVRRVARPTPVRRVWPSGGDQDVSRAEVEVGQTGGVGCPEGVEQLQAHAGHPGDLEGAVPGDELVEGHAVDQLGGHVDDAVGDDHVVEADQAGMVEGGRHPGLGGDPGPQGGLVGTGRVGASGEAELLDRQLPAVGRVGGLPDHAGRAAAQRGMQRPAAGDEPLGGVV